MCTDGKISDSGLQAAEQLAVRLRGERFDSLYTALDPASVATAGIIAQQWKSSPYRAAGLQLPEYGDPALDAAQFRDLEHRLRLADIKGDREADGQLRKLYAKVGGWTCKLAARGPEQHVLAVAPAYTVAALRGMAADNLADPSAVDPNRSYELAFGPATLWSIRTTLDQLYGESAA